MNVMDFADYRLRMRSGTPAETRSFYLAGLTHGVRHGATAVDRDLRTRLAGAIRDEHPNAVVHDPVESWYADGAADREPADYHRLAGLAAGSEVCVAWLPDRDAIADSVAEMQVARRAGGTVVAITDDADDFLVRTFASVVLPDVAAFSTWLRAA
jgi:hypothetical protein